MNSPHSATQAGKIGHESQELIPQIMKIRDDSMQNQAKSLAEVSDNAGIENSEPPLKANVRALQAARAAYFAIRAGNGSDWLYLMELRQSSHNHRKESNRKLAALCSGALEHPDLPESMIEEVTFARDHFCAMSEN